MSSCSNALITITILISVYICGYETWIRRRFYVQWHTQNTCMDFVFHLPLSQLHFVSMFKLTKKRPLYHYPTNSDHRRTPNITLRYTGGGQQLACRKVAPCLAASLPTCLASPYTGRGESSRAGQQITWQTFGMEQGDKYQLVHSHCQHTDRYTDKTQWTRGRKSKIHSRIVFWTV